jgi:hypothetical protein
MRRAELRRTLLKRTTRKRMTTDATPTPDDRRKVRMKDFYFTIGVAVVQWQHVEVELNELFCLLVGGDDRVASAVFSTITSFPTKLRMVKAAALVRFGESNLFGQCKRLCKYLEDVEGGRNRIAHFMMYWDIPAGEDFKVLMPPLKTSDIENRTKEFAKASEKIRNFIAQVKVALAAGSPTRSTTPKKTTEQKAP